MYHYGLTVKEYREAKGLTQAQLAEKWPKSNGDTGVKPDYVSLVENGKRQISDINILRGLCDILDIPLWRFGLSEYNPFKPEDLPTNGRYLYDETLNLIEGMIENSWYLRKTSPIPITVDSLSKIDATFNYLETHASIHSRQELRYKLLYGHYLRLRAMMLVEQGKYQNALQGFETLRLLGNEIDNSTLLSLAYTGIGKELLRDGNKQGGLLLLEKARDYAFECDKTIIATVHSFLARAYADVGDELRFHRAIDTAYRIATNVGNDYDKLNRLNQHNLSSIIEEKSNGLILLGHGKEALSLKDDIEREVDKEGSFVLKSWLPLDYAQSYLAMNELEKSIEELKVFYNNVKFIKSSFAFRRIYEHIEKIGNINRELAKGLYDEVNSTL